MLKSLVLLLVSAGLASAQNNPLLSGDNPSVMLGSQRYNVGTVRVFAGSGLPTTVTSLNGTPLVGGDIYIDIGNNVSYQCQAFPGPCTAVGPLNWVREATPSVVSIAAFGVNGSSSDPANLATALSAAAGNFCLYFPQTITVNLSGGSHMNVPSKSCLTGDGPTLSKINASGLSTPGFGVFDIPLGATDITIEKIGIDGGVTSSTGVSYTTAAAATPAGAIFTTGSTFWVHSNATNITFRDVQISHTGGYAIYWDATQGPTSRVRMYRVVIQNSRPHLFGNPSPTIYGSWTGGVLFEQGLNIAYGFTDVVVDGCTWQNVVGNALWFSRQASTPQTQSFSVRVTNNTFTDIGLDAVQVNAIDGYVETGNKVQRFGYVVISDVGATRVGGPLWLQGFVPVAFDTFAPLTNFVRNDNWAMGNGQMFDLDGASRGSVIGNSHVSCFLSPDPLANHAQCGPSGFLNQNFDRFVVTNNSSGIFTYNPQYLTFSGNTTNGVGNGAFILFGCRFCNVIGNTIYAESATSNPIVLGNIGTNLLQHASNNMVVNNSIYWVPTTGAAAVFEDGSTACSCPFSNLDINFVRNNTLLPAGLFATPMYEFQKSTTSGSGTGSLTLSSVTPGAPSGSPFSSVLQTEGTLTPTFNVYSDILGIGVRVLTASPQGLVAPLYTFVQLPLVSSAGQMVYCTNCTPSTRPCTAGGTGATAVTNATQWNCGGN